MKKKLSILVAGAALFLNPLVGNSQEFEPQYNHTGEEFYNWCQNYPNGAYARNCAAYLDSAVLLLKSGSSSAGPDVKVCVPDGTAMKDIVSAFVSHLDANPDLMQERGGMAITSALTSAYPCD